MRRERSAPPKGSDRSCSPSSYSPPVRGWPCVSRSRRRSPPHLWRSGLPCRRSASWLGTAGGRGVRLNCFGKRSFGARHRRHRPGPATRGGLSFDIAGGGVLMSAPDGRPEDLRAEPSLAMRHALGNHGSTAMASSPARRRHVGGQGHSRGRNEDRLRGDSQFARGNILHGPRVPFPAGSRRRRRCVGRQRGPEARSRCVDDAAYSASLPESLAMCVDCVRDCAAEASLTTSRPPVPAYLKGVSFSHAGRATGGRGRTSGRRELARIRDIRANALALAPFAFDAATEETSFRFRTSQTDSRLLRTGRQAHDPGMLAMLKPHPWAGRRFHGENALKRKARFDV